MGINKRLNGVNSTHTIWISLRSNENRDHVNIVETKTFVVHWSILGRGQSPILSILENKLSNPWVHRIVDSCDGWHSELSWKVSIWIQYRLLLVLMEDQATRFLSLMIADVLVVSLISP